MFLTLSLWRFLRRSFDDAHRTYFRALLLPELIQTGYAEATATGLAAEVQWDSEDLTTYCTAGNTCSWRVLASILPQSWSWMYGSLLHACVYNRLQLPQIWLQWPEPMACKVSPLRHIFLQIFVNTVLLNVALNGRRGNPQVNRSFVQKNVLSTHEQNIITSQKKYNSIENNFTLDDPSEE